MRTLHEECKRVAQIAGEEIISMGTLPATIACYMEMSDGKVKPVFLKLEEMLNIVNGRATPEQLMEHIAGFLQKRQEKLVMIVQLLNGYGIEYQNVEAMNSVRSAKEIKPEDMARRKEVIAVMGMSVAGDESMVILEVDNTIQLKDETKPLGGKAVRPLSEFSKEGGKIMINREKGKDKEVTDINVSNPMLKKLIDKYKEKINAPTDTSAPAAPAISTKIHL